MRFFSVLLLACSGSAVRVPRREGVAAKAGASRGKSEHVKVEAVAQSEPVSFDVEVSSLGEPEHPEVEATSLVQPEAEAALPGEPEDSEVEVALAAVQQDAARTCAPLDASRINAQLRKPSGKYPEGRVKPCGYYRSRCSNLEVIEANVDHPGQNHGDILNGTVYIVQFDIGAASPDPADIPPSRWPGGVECLEVILKGNDNFGNLGVPGMKNDAYNCMGTCGAGCGGVGTAKDCGKHDVCSAFKSIDMNAAASGFCNDADCGDEAAQSVYNCKHALPPWGEGKYSMPANCNCQEQRATTGHFDRASMLFFRAGNCRAWGGCHKGEGIPSY